MYKWKVLFKKDEEFNQLSFHQVFGFKVIFRDKINIYKSCKYLEKQ